MTHSLHRRGTRESLANDFVVLGCPATGVNKKGSAPKTQKFLSICYKHGPINLGDMKTGNIYNTTMDDILSRVTDGTIVECTFDNREKIVCSPQGTERRPSRHLGHHLRRHRCRPAVHDRGGDWAGSTPSNIPSAPGEIRAGCPISRSSRRSPCAVTR